MDIDIEKEAYIRASSYLLSEKMPEDFQNMTASEARDYCSEKGIIPSYSPTETLDKIDQLRGDFLSFNELVEKLKLKDVCKDYVDKMVSSELVTQEEGSKFYEEFTVEQEVVGSQQAFEKLASHVEDVAKGS